MKSYCTQNKGDCSTCSLVNYGRDCRNQPLNVIEKALQEERMTAAVKCSECGHYMESEEHGHVKRRCGSFTPAVMVPKDAKDCAPVWCPRR